MESSDHETAAGVAWSARLSEVAELATDLAEDINLLGPRVRATDPAVVATSRRLTNLAFGLSQVVAGYLTSLQPPPISAHAAVLGGNGLEPPSVLGRGCPGLAGEAPEQGLQHTVDVAEVAVRTQKLLVLMADRGWSR